MESSQRQGRSSDNFVAVLGGHCVREHAGDSGGGEGEIPSHGHQLLRHIVGVRGLSGRAGGDAVQRDLRGPGESLVIHDRLVRRLAIVRRAVLHRVDPEPVRDQPGPLLGDHRPVHLSEQNEQEASGHPDRDRLDLLVGDLVSGDRLVEGGPNGGGTGGQVSVYRAPRLPHLLVHHQLLRAAVRHGLYVLQDLPSGRDPDQKPEARHQASYNGLR